jgi:hypothetical protein
MKVTAPQWSVACAAILSSTVGSVICPLTAPAVSVPRKGTTVAAVKMTPMIMGRVPLVNLAEQFVRICSPCDWNQQIWFDFAKVSVIDNHITSEFSLH